MATDKILTCSDCGQEFTFTASEQDFYTERGFSDPRRCPACRQIRKAQRGTSTGSTGGGYQSGGESGYGGGAYGSSGGGYSSGGGSSYGSGGSRSYSDRPAREIGRLEDREVGAPFLAAIEHAQQPAIAFRGGLRARHEDRPSTRRARSSLCRARAPRRWPRAA